MTTLPPEPRPGVPVRHGPSAAPDLSAPRPALQNRLRDAMFQPAPLARVAVLRVIIYLFVIADLFFIVNDVVPHASGSAGLYRPIDLRSGLHLPIPDPFYVQAERAVLVLSCLAMVSGRLPRRPALVAGLVVAAGFTDWVSIGMSYSKIDHDHFALIAAVWVLPSVGVARASSRSRSEAAGWALLCVQLGCVATYFLSAWAKVRYGGWDWVTGSTFAWAMTRRGTGLGKLLLDPPWILTVSQAMIWTLELSSPLLVILRGRALYLFVAMLAGFHLGTYLTLKIHFLPLVVCLLSFLPLERLPELWTRRSPAAVRVAAQ